jgi:hypothetical protein
MQAAVKKSIGQVRGKPSQERMGFIGAPWIEKVDGTYCVEK